MKCNYCGTEYEGNFCPECGAKKELQTTSTPPPIPQPIVNEQSHNYTTGSNETVFQKPKKPIYKKWWFYVIIAVALIVIIGAFSGGSKSEKIKWNDMVLGSQLPEPPYNKGEIHENSSDKLWVDIENISDKQYNDYVESCKSKGFTIDAQLDSYSFDAYNAEGYKLSLSHYGNNEELSIDLEKPIKMSDINWPSSHAGKQLPVPKSTTGKFSYEHDDEFCVYIGNTSKSDYNNYVKACSDKGFTVDYDKGDNYYDADNSDGWHISLKYEGNNIMSIEITASSNDSNEDSKENSSATPSKDTTDAAKTETTKSKTTESNTSKKGTTSAKGVSKYETIYNEYSKKIKDAAPTSSVSELAEITNEGVGKMADCMLTAKGTDGQYSTYEKWAGKLMDVYTNEAR